jgi:hypothetical protein
MKQNHTMYIYKTDKRTKSGERLVYTYVLENRDSDGMLRESRELYDVYPPSKGYRFEWFPTMKTVRNLMSGKDIEIPRDTPRCCDPSSETYWSM